ncbi:MAG TPA: hypothetical protein VFQ45_22245 [Longimicrobium sp.]|nr:hypothetical protein [Longimicrobium sp.]
MNRFLFRAALCTAALSLAACSAEGGPGPSLSGDEDPNATIFLARDSEPNGYMEALYVGAVLRDAQGCLRTADTGVGATIVWPTGFTLAAHGSGLFVHNAEGELVGQVDHGTVRMGGGFIRDISSATVLSEKKKALAVSKCPGDYWIAGEVDTAAGR